MEEIDQDTISSLKAEGLRILYEGPNPEVDIVAVHGLGCNPDWAWVRKVEDDDHKRKRDGNIGPKLVNWLADEDMLSSKLPNSRIMTYNYLSKWHAEAPVQRRLLCAGDMLDAIHMQRRQDPETEHRPLIFIGHSFGGIVIEQALVSAEGDEEYRHISLATIGFISLGTPFRGSAATKWAELIAITGQKLGLGSSKDILEDLHTDSTRLTDLRHPFALWLFRQSVPVYCFFEQYMTDYGRRYGLKWREMVVDENSACLDGHRKLLLPTDHLKMNKFASPDDDSYIRVSSKILEIYHNEIEKVEQRRNPRTLAESNGNLSDINGECVRDLILTDPVDDLAAAKRAKGERVTGTCEWILTRGEYTRWLVESRTHLLYLIGEPGIGKTMIATFLVDEMSKKASQSHQIVFAYYFCDNKDHNRRTATSVLRGILLQISRQRPALFEKFLVPEYKEKEKRLFDNFDALCRVLRLMLIHPDMGEAYILVDALDECEEQYHHDLMESLETFSGITDASQVKIVITSRPTMEILEIEQLFSENPLSVHPSVLIRIDSAAVNHDLCMYIEEAVANLPRRFPHSTKAQVEQALKDRAGGTFLWASLVLRDISKTSLASSVPQKLRTLPRDLNEVYNRILRGITEDEIDDASIILQCISVAFRPLSIQQLAVAWMIGRGSWKQNFIPRAEDISEFEDCWKCCGALVRLDRASTGDYTNRFNVDSRESTHYDTVNFVHQSAKEFLQSSRLPELSKFTFDFDDAHWLMFRISQDFLTMKDFDHLSRRLGSKYVDGQDVLLEKRERLWWTELINEPTNSLSQYFAFAWCDHAITAGRQKCRKLLWPAGWLKVRPDMSLYWLQEAIVHNQMDMVRQMIELGVDINQILPSYDTTPLCVAINNTLEGMVKLLLEFDQCDVNARGEKGENALLISVKQLLLSRAAGMDAASLSFWGYTSLLIADQGRNPLSFAAGNGDLACVTFLLSRSDIAADACDEKGRTPLSWAADNLHATVLSILLSRDDVVADSQDEDGRTPLSYAAGGQDHLSSDRRFYEDDGISYPACLRLFLSRNDVLVESCDKHGRTPLSHAAVLGQEVNKDRLGYRKGLEILLQHPDVVVGSQDRDGNTPLALACKMLNHISATMLLDIGKSPVNTHNHGGQTPLSLAIGSWNNTFKLDKDWNDSVLRMIDRVLDAGADVNQPAVKHQIAQVVEGVYGPNTNVFSYGTHDWVSSMSPERLLEMLKEKGAIIPQVSDVSSSHSSASVTSSDSDSDSRSEEGD